MSGRRFYRNVARRRASLETSCEAYGRYRHSPPITQSDDAEADVDLDSFLDPDNPSPYALIGLAITIVTVAALGLLFLVG